MTDKFSLKEICGEYKFFEKGDSFPLTEKQILNKLNENEQLKKSVRRQQKSNEECSKYIEEVAKKNKELEEELHKFKKYVFSDEKILCYSCANCISKGIYKVECSEKGKVDVHSTCFSYWKNEVRLSD